jgi:FecR protein
MNMLTRKKGLIVMMGFSALLFSVMIGCEKKEIALASVSFITGDVSVKRGADVHKAVLKEEIKTGDILSTGEKSFIIVQTTDQDVFRVQEKSTLEFSTLSQKDTTLVLSKGSVLSKITKLKKEDTCTVKTPLAVAAVRGTQFLTTYDGKQSIVAVGEGKVSVSKIGATDDKALDEGKTAVVDKNVDIRDYNKEEKTELAKMNAVAHLEDLDKKSDAELNDIGKKILEADEKLSENNKLMTLEEIQAKYKRIDVVTLYSGLVVRGAVLSRGKTFQIITPTGMQYIESNKIKRTTSR